MTKTEKDAKIWKEASINDLGSHTYSAFYDFIMKNYDFKIFAEIGIWKGFGVCHLASLLKNKKDVEIYAVDLFEDLEDYPNLVRKYMLSRLGDDIKNMQKMFKYNLKRFEVEKLVTVIKGLSIEVAKLFEDEYFDMVFIDADHEYENIKIDIKAWIPKVREGGIISGHDYVGSQPGVRKAVDEIFGKDIQIHPQYVWYKEI